VIPASLNGRALQPLLLREALRCPPAHVHRRRVARLLQPARHVGHVAEEQQHVAAAGKAAETGHGRRPERNSGPDARPLLRIDDAGDGGAAEALCMARLAGLGRSQGMAKARAMLLELIPDYGMEAAHLRDHLFRKTAREGPVL
jgi:hypothetical protein